MAKINVAEVVVTRRGELVASAEVSRRGIHRLVANSRMVVLELSRGLDFAMDLDALPDGVLGITLGFKDRFVGIEKKRMGVTASVYWMGRGDVSITTDDGSVKVVVKWREVEEEEASPA